MGPAYRAEGGRITAFDARRALRSGARGATGRRARHFGSICIFQQDQREERRARARPSTRFRGCLGLIWAPITSRGGPNRPLRPGEDAAQRTDKCISTRNVYPRADVALHDTEVAYGRSPALSLSRCNRSISKIGFYGLYCHFKSHALIESNVTPP